jgi:hypothetical protein
MLNQTDWLWVCLYDTEEAAEFSIGPLCLNLVSMDCYDCLKGYTQIMAPTREQDRQKQQQMGETSQGDTRDLQGGFNALELGSRQQGIQAGVTQETCKEH